MRHKFWEGHPITKVMRTLWQDGWTIQRINEFFVKAGIEVSPTTIQNEKHKLKTGAAPAYLNDREREKIQEIMSKKLGDIPPPPKDDYVQDDEEPTPTPHNGEATSKLVNLLQEVKRGVDGIDSRLTLVESKVEEQNEKIAQIEEIALATCKKISVEHPEEITFDLDETSHPALDQVLRMLRGVKINGSLERINVMMIGPAGCGKTYLAGQASRVLKTRFGFGSFSAGTSESQALGRIIPIGADGAFTYVPTEFVEIFEGGGIFLFDEMDAADANMLIVFNAALDGKKLALPSRHKKPYATKHEGTMLMAACNTFGTGADRQYVGRNQLDEAFLDRWRAGQIEMDYDPGLEAKICPDEELRSRLQTYRKNCRIGIVRRVISSRFLKQAYILKKLDFTDDQIDAKLFAGWKKEEVDKAKAQF